MATVSIQPGSCLQPQDGWATPRSRALRDGAGLAPDVVSSLFLTTQRPGCFCWIPGPSLLLLSLCFLVQQLLFLTYSSRFCLLGSPMARERKTRQFWHPLLKQSPPRRPKSSHLPSASATLALGSAEPS